MLAVLLVLLRRRLAVLLVLLRRRLAVLLVLLLGRRLRVLLVLLGGGLSVVPLLLRRGRALSRRRRGFVGVFPLLGVIVLLRRARRKRQPDVGGTAVRRPRREGKSARARARSSVLMSRRDASTRGRRAPCESPHASRRASWRERDRLDFDALLFADRGSRTDTVGGCVNSGPAKGLCGGNWMNPDPTTREGFCGATDRGAEGSVGVRTGGRPGTRGASIAARR